VQKTRTSDALLVDKALDGVPSIWSRLTGGRMPTHRGRHMRETALATLAFLLLVTGAAVISTWMHPPTDAAAPQPDWPAGAL
jgi:hypothetical protein